MNSVVLIEIGTAMSKIGTRLMPLSIIAIIFLIAVYFAEK